MRAKQGAASCRFKSPVPSVSHGVSRVLPLFHQQDHRTGWDGKSQSSRCPVGTSRDSSSQQNAPHLWKGWKARQGWGERRQGTAYWPGHWPPPSATLAQALSSLGRSSEVWGLQVVARACERARGEGGLKSGWEEKHHRPHTTREQRLTWLQGAEPRRGRGGPGPPARPPVRSPLGRAAWRWREVL